MCALRIQVGCYKRSAIEERILVAYVRLVLQASCKLHFDVRMRSGQYDNLPTISVLIFKCFTDEMYYIYII